MIKVRVTSIQAIQSNLKPDLYIAYKLSTMTRDLNASWLSLLDAWCLQIWRFKVQYWSNIGFEITVFSLQVWISQFVEIWYRSNETNHKELQWVTQQLIPWTNAFQKYSFFALLSKAFMTRVVKTPLINLKGLLQMSSSLEPRGVVEHMFHMRIQVMFKLGFTSTGTWRST